MEPPRPNTGVQPKFAIHLEKDAENVERENLSREKGGLCNDRLVADAAVVERDHEFTTI